MNKIGRFRKGSFVFFFIWGILLLIFLLAIFLIYPFFSKKQILSCGDGTLYNKCSQIKPYFCKEGVLVKKASVCQCSNSTFKLGNSCISKYQNDSKTIQLNYTLNGVHKKIDFVVYKGLTDYLYNLPVYLNGNVSREDFKIRNINNLEQRELLLPLVVEIQNSEKDEINQVRAAISIVQNIPYNSSGKKLKFVRITDIEYSRYPYETLYDLSGLCGEKTELLTFLLKEIGYGSAYFYYKEENHEAAGIKCPISESVNKSGYCFIETTAPAILSDNKEEYLGFGRLISSPEIFVMSEGKSLGDIEEYADAKEWIDLDRKIKIEKKEMSSSDFRKWKSLVNKYGLEIPDILKEIVNVLQSKP